MSELVIKNIRKFCATKDIKLFRKLDQITKSLFYKYASQIPSLDISEIILHEQEIPKSLIYISSIKRGESHPNLINVKNINVTSGSKNKINNQEAKQLSPMYLGPVTNEILNKELLSTPIDAICFENYWQYGKVFEELDHLDGYGKVTDTWEKFRNKGYSRTRGDRHPLGTKTCDVLYTYKNYGKICNKYRYMIACCSQFYGSRGNPIKLKYIAARQRIYVPVYAALVKKTQFYKELKKEVDKGMNVNILDYDGPEHYLKINKTILRQKLHNPLRPFGHGYVIAGLLAGIEPYEYLM